jgi:hypothetical protein
MTLSGNEVPRMVRRQNLMLGTLMDMIIVWRGKTWAQSLCGDDHFTNDLYSRSTRLIQGFYMLHDCVRSLLFDTPGRVTGIHLRIVRYAATTPTDMAAQGHRRKA